MKKFVLILLVLTIACTAVFAGASIGFSQGLINTSFVASYEWDKFGVQGDVGLPLIYSTIGFIGAVNEKVNNDSEEEINILDFILPGAHVGAYWKAVNGKHFGWNLGLGGSFQSYFMKNKVRVIGMASVTSGLVYKFNEKFSMGLDTSVPLAFLLAPISSEAAQATFFYYVQGESEPGDIFAILLGASYYGINELARLSFKWSI